MVQDVLWIITDPDSEYTNYEVYNILSDTSFEFFFCDIESLWFFVAG